MLNVLITVGSFLIDLFKTKAHMDDKIHENVNKALIDIANLLESVVEDLEKDIYPHGKCAQMDMLAKNLGIALEGNISHDYLDFLKINLNSAVELEKLYAYREDPSSLQQLKIAAGYFRAAAILSNIG